MVNIMKIYIIRHGETDWNTVRRLQGRADIQLNDEGRRLAKVTSEALKDIQFSRIYTSPLKRAYETALIIKGDRDIPVIKDERIIEISFREYEGLHCGKNNYDIPDPEFKNFFDAPDKYCPAKGAESIDELCDRTADFFDEIINDKALQEDTILISTHGAALRGLLQFINKSERKDFWGSGVHKNCAVTIVNVDNGNVIIVEEGKIYY